VDAVTDEERQEQRVKLISECKKYNHIDYDDDEDIIELMFDVAVAEMTELIPDFSMETLTPRQHLLILVCVKDLYDNREKYGKEGKKLQAAVSSMLLKEMYGGTK